MTDGTTIAHTSPLAELHPDAPITITRRQLEAACALRLRRIGNEIKAARTHPRYEEAIQKRAADEVDKLLADLHTAAQQLQADAGVPA